MGPSTVPESTLIVGVVENAQVEVVHLLRERTKAETHVPTVVGLPNLEVLPAAVAIVHIESSKLSFGWAMADRGFIEGANGFYYD